MIGHSFALVKGKGSKTADFGHEFMHKCVVRVEKRPGAHGYENTTIVSHPRMANVKGHAGFRTSSGCHSLAASVEKAS